MSEDTKLVDAINRVRAERKRLVMENIILREALERIYSPYLTPDYSSSDLRELAGQAIIDAADGKMTVDDALMFVDKSDTNLGIALDTLAHEVIRLQKALHYIGYDCKAWGDFTFRDYAREALQRVGGEGC